MKKQIGFNILFFLSFFFAFIPQTRADTIYLKNTRSMDGIIIREDENSVELQIRIGVVKFEKSEISSIYRSTPREARIIRRKWNNEDLAVKQRQEEQLALKKKMAEEEEKKKKEAPNLTKEAQGLIVNAVINNKHNASLILDTGASMTVLTSAMAKKIGITPEPNGKIIYMLAANGKKIDAQYCVLKSLTVHDMEAKNVEAAIIRDPSADQSLLKDGLLGMSFLSRFNFKIDNGKKQLILEEIKDNK